MRRLILLWMLAVGVLMEEARCPHYCHCYNEPDVFRTANCTTSVFSVQIPADSSIDALNVRPQNRGHALKLLPRMFKYFKDIESLNLSNCSVSNLPKDVFMGLNYVVEIDLSYNKIKHLNGVVFSHLGNLETLRLRGNPLLLNPWNSLVSKTLRTLDLGYCSLRGLSANVFSSVPNLTHLSLDGNELTTLHYNVLPPRLVYLNLVGNRIVNVPTDVLASMTNLWRIDLSDNPINCTCHLLFLQDNFSGRGITFGNDVVCAYPTELEGKNINKVKEDGPCIDEPLLKERHMNQIKYSSFFARKEKRHHKVSMFHDPGFQADQPVDTEVMFSNPDTRALGTHMEHTAHEDSPTSTEESNTKPHEAESTEVEGKENGEKGELEDNEDDSESSPTDSYPDEDTTYLTSIEENEPNHGPEAVDDSDVPSINHDGEGHKSTESNNAVRISDEENATARNLDKESLEDEPSGNEDVGFEENKEDPVAEEKEVTIPPEEELITAQEDFSGDMASEELTDVDPEKHHTVSEEDPDKNDETTDNNFDVVTTHDFARSHEHSEKLTTGDESPEVSHVEESGHSAEEISRTEDTVDAEHTSETPHEGEDESAMDHIKEGEGEPESTTETKANESTETEEKEDHSSETVTDAPYEQLSSDQPSDSIEDEITGANSTEDHESETTTLSEPLENKSTEEETIEAVTFSSKEITTEISENENSDNETIKVALTSENSYAEDEVTSDNYNESSIESTTELATEPSDGYEETSETPDVEADTSVSTTESHSGEEATTEESSSEPFTVFEVTSESSTEPQIETDVTSESSTEPQETESEDDASPISTEPYSTIDYTSESSTEPHHEEEDTTPEMTTEPHIETDSVSESSTEPSAELEVTSESTTVVHFEADVTSESTVLLDDSSEEEEDEEIKDKEHTTEHTTHDDTTTHAEDIVYHVTVSGVDSPHNSSKEEYKGAATEKESTYESLGSYIVVAAIVVLVLGLIILAVCKRKKSSAKIRLPNDAESNLGTEMQDMDSLLPKPPENGVKIVPKNYGEPNGSVSKEEVTPVLQPEPEPEPKQELNGTVQRATARLTVLPESIPKTPVFIHKPYPD